MVGGADPEVGLLRLQFYCTGYSVSLLKREAEQY
jgi:hypothetical protein